GGNGRRRQVARPTYSYRARDTRLDVSGPGRAADQRDAGRGGRQRHLPRTRRSQPLLSARDERADVAVAERRRLTATISFHRSAPLTPAKRCWMAIGTTLQHLRCAFNTEGSAMRTLVGMILGALL